MSEPDALGRQERPSFQECSQEDADRQFGFTLPLLSNALNTFAQVCLIKKPYVFPWPNYYAHLRPADRPRRAIQDKLRKATCEP